ncbi:hypothetical protein EBESD8_2270 [Rhodococcus aetherivorans]|nr:hypothetical protein EBESD8_2270 [Rhodococcus aetherivorans]
MVRAPLVLLGGVTDPAGTHTGTRCVLTPVPNPASEKVSR